MAKDKSSFILYADYIHTVEHLTDEQTGILFKHILDYVNDRHPTTANIYVNLAFEPIKQQLKRDLKKYETKRENYSKSGKEGNLKRWNLPIYKQYKEGKISLEDALIKASHRQESPPDTSRSQPVAFVAVNDTVTVNVTVNDINNRLVEFKNSLKPFLKTYGKNILNEFYDYWTEKKPKGRKLRFEMEKTWDVSKRLTRWKNNDFNKNNQNERKQQLTEIADQFRKRNESQGTISSSSRQNRLKKL